MATKISDYVHVANRAKELGCVTPTGITVLPENFENAASRSELLFGSEAATIRKLLKSDVPMGSLLPTGERAPAIHNKHFEWAPAIFVSAALLSENPNAISVALGIVSNYATDFFKGRPSRKVKLTVVVETKKDRSCKRIDYEGDASGLASLANIVRQLGDD